MNTVLEELGKIGIVPVIKIDDVEKAVPLARALAAGGIPCTEITFRTAQGEEAIRRISKAVREGELPEVLAGAGTVLTCDQVDRAVDAGAKFIVSPGFNPKVVAYCIKKGIPVTPGCSTPSDMEQALEFGLDVVKFFPAEQAGGLDYIKAVSAPYPSLKFMPTGGINAGNIAKYLAFEKVLACGGSWMASSDLINAGEFEKITALSREAVLNMLGFRLAHIGVNSGAEEAAVKKFASLFGFPVKDSGGSVIAGAKGHIAIGTNNITRAVAYLERNGVTSNGVALNQNDGVYLKEEILGLKVRLV